MILALMALILIYIVFIQQYLYEKIWHKNLDIDINFSPTTITQGEESYLHVHVANRKFLPLPWLYITLNLSNKIDNDHILFSVWMYQRIKRKILITAQPRGIYRIRSATAISSNLLNTKTYEKHIQTFTELTVLPKLLEDYQAPDLIYKDIDAMLLSTSLTNPDPFEFKGIREYLPTDPLKSINFKATAITGELMVNMYTPTSSRNLDIILDLSTHAPKEHTAQREHAISLAATLATHYIKTAANVGLYTNGRGTYTGGNISIAKSSNPSHIGTILTALTHIDYNIYRTDPLTDYISNLTNPNTVHLIIYIEESEVKTRYV